ncbi:hypothetical protein H0A36_19620 [Endozoicomonas sp. SM1973]|uniref:Uncharacterized protein n=1 Tax=Spartinivicinus marinus TaxID=2994442 RepID=A0A853IE56_9GAMM|nr:hypothetical protein [Spartinivicinus marinus]MCX4027953.1 hypothetical protein [Spartinivicinus marinus]NYZ68231.1 hypothetical protein [Spartinivicinus marinus]
MNLKIDDKSVPIDIFCLPEMSLSSARAKMTKWTYSLSIKEQEFIELLEDEYHQLISDLKEDDEQVGEIQDELGKAGYPALDKVLQDNELLFSTIYYLFENLISNFSSSGASTVYWHDDITSCEYKQGKVYIYGICYSKAQT